MSIIMRLNEVAKEIRDLIQVRQESLGLVFEENKHIYTMNGRKDYPSVSKVLKKFYKEFPTEEAAYNKAGGDPQRQQELIEEWGLEYAELKGLLRKLGGEADSLQYNLIASEALRLSQCISDVQQMLLESVDADVK